MRHRGFSHIGLSTLDLDRMPAGGEQSMTGARATESGWRKRFTLTLCFFAILCEGIDIMSMGLAAPPMAPELGLTRDQLGPLFSVSIVWLLVGAVIFGRIADRFGRKWTLVICLVIFGVFSLATAAVRPFEALLAVRLAAGLGLGGALPNLVALAAEAVAPESRAGLVTRITCGLPFGGAICGMVAVNLDWQAIFYVGGLAPLALAPIAAFALPESRAFIEVRQSASPTAAARDDFRWIGGGRAGATLLLWTASFASLLALYVLLNWLPTLLGDRGLWCSLTDPDDMEGQLVDDDKEMARRTAKALAHGERVFVPVVIRAIRQRCGLTQREAGLVFGTGEKSFEKYESGEIQPSAPTKRLLELAMAKPELFKLPDDRRIKSASSVADIAFVREALRAAHIERLYEPLFAEPL